MFSGHQPDLGSRIAGNRSLHIQHAARGLSNGFKLLHRQESKSFIRQVRSPGHLLFFASNVALLLHVKYISTRNKQAEMEKHLLHMNELENYEEVIKNLDAQEEAVRNQIAILKSQRSKKQGHKDAETKPIMRRDFLKQSYSSQRSAISSVLKNEANIKSLFQNQGHVSYEESSNVNETSPQKISYSSTISHSLMMLSNMFIKSFLVELNLRRAFDDSSVTRLYSNSNYLLCKDLFHSMKRDETKEHLFARLMELRGRSHTFSNPIWRHFDENSLEDLLLGFLHSDSFRSRESMRLDYFYHKSGRCLNYDNANKSRHISAMQSPTFYSDIESSAAYIEDFRKIFAKFDADCHPMKHLNLVLSLAQRLIQNGDFIPQISVFKELLELLGRAKLYNYQSMVYDTLPGFEYVKNILADGERPHEFAKKTPEYFSSIIQQDPSILESLIKYQVVRNDSETLKHLLAFLEPTQYSSGRKGFTLPNFMNTWGPSVSSPTKSIHGVSLVSTSVIENAIEACVELKEYGQIDKILGKLVYDSVRLPEGIKIVLQDNTENLTFFSQTSSEQTVRRQLFSDKIICLLGAAYLDSSDKSRCKWLLSLLDQRLSDAPSGNIQELRQKILRFTQDSDISTAASHLKRSRVSAHHDTSGLHSNPKLFNFSGNSKNDADRGQHADAQSPVMQEVYVA